MKRRHCSSAHAFLSDTTRLLACLAAGYVLYCDVMGSLVNKLFLFGVSAKPNNTLAYQTTLLPQFLPTLVRSRDAVGAALRSMLGDTDISNAVAYLDADITTQQPVLQDVFCRKPVGYDYLFNVTYLKPVVHHVFAGFSDWNMSKWWIIVDCSFEGREIADTTVIKFYLLSKDMTQLTTFLVQTLTITRPEKQLRTAGGVAMWTTTPLDSFQIQDNGRIVTSYKAKYYFAIGFSFPFDWQHFDPITIENLEPPDGQWHAQVTSTKEKFTFSGTSGIFRRSPRVQGSFNYWFWRLPSNPIEFMSTLQFVGVKVFKDSWGWFRCLLCDGISSNIFVNFVVSILVMANIYWKEKTIWIPDVYPSFQKRAAVRAGLLLVDCVINGWWYPFQWAVNQSSVRNHWGGTLDFNEISLDDGIVVILAIAYIVAYIVCVRVQLVVVVIIYMSCYYMRQELNGAMGIFAAKVAPDIKQNYFNNIVSSRMEAMDLWTYYENFETNFWLIANECTYLIVAMGISIFFVLLTKLATWKPELSLLSYIHFGFKGHVHPIASIQVGARGHKLWTLRSTLYHELDEKDVENTKIERCAGTILQETYGFVAMTVDYEKDRGRVYVTPQGLWLLGFVIVNDQYVVEINDYIYVVINSLSGRNFFSVYGFALTKDSTSTRKHCIHAKDISGWDVWLVSLKRLR